MIKLSPRLRAISDLIDEDDVVLDVGCDHALLSIDLALKGNKVYASDKSSGAIQGARANLKKYEVEDLVDLAELKDLDFLNEEVNTIVIAGMGALTIIEILKKNLDKLRKIEKFIFLAHNHQKRLRKFIADNNFLIDDELVVKEGNKYYFIMKVIKGKANYDDLELEFGAVNLKRKDKTFLDYLAYYIKTQEKILSKLSKEEQDKLSIKIERLKKI